MVPIEYSFRQLLISSSILILAQNFFSILHMLTRLVKVNLQEN